MSPAYNGHTDVVQLLLSANVDVNAKDKKGKTALMRAKNRGHNDIVKLLTAAGAKE
jgi:ankyrin repeat protein